VIFCGSTDFTAHGKRALDGWALERRSFGSTNRRGKLCSTSAIIVFVFLSFVFHFHQEPGKDHDDITQRLLVGTDAEETAKRRKAKAESRRDWRQAGGRGMLTHTLLGFSAYLRAFSPGF